MTIVFIIYVYVIIAMVYSTLLMKGMNDYLGDLPMQPHGVMTVVMMGFLWPIILIGQILGLMIGNEDE